MIQITPQMRVLVGVEPVDFRAGIEGLAGRCRTVLAADPFSGTAFVFRNRRRTAIKILVYDGQVRVSAHRDHRFRHRDHGCRERDYSLNPIIVIAASAQTGGGVTLGGPDLLRLHTHAVEEERMANGETAHAEDRRLQGKDRQYIKGQKYTLLSHRANLTLDGRRALKKLLAANQRLNTAYLLKESFGQLWDCRSEG